VKPLVIAHRGACWDAPENSLEAFELGLEEGADYIEFDVRAKDGRLVVCHDPHPPPGVPTLDEVLDAMAGRIGLCVELKEEAVGEETIAVLRGRGVPPDEIIVVSFLETALDTALRVWPELRTAFHLGPRPEPPRAARFWGAGFEEPAPAEQIREAQELGLATLVFTVNDPDRMRELAEFGVTGIFSDRPGLLRETLASAPGTARGRSREEKSR
jgi:glycerophosphoryl diester phosphodiesterase